MRGNRMYLLAVGVLIAGFVLAWKFADANSFAMLAGAALTSAGAVNYSERKYERRQRSLPGPFGRRSEDPELDTGEE